MSDELARIQSIIDAIRTQEVRPGTRIRTATTLVTCPADMDQIERHLAEYATVVRAQVIEELAQRAENQSRNVDIQHRHPEGDYVTFGPLADWVRAQQETPHE